MDNPTLRVDLASAGNAARAAHLREHNADAFVLHQSVPPLPLAPPLQVTSQRETVLSFGQR
jgi:hypothetical protein